MYNITKDEALSLLQKMRQIRQTSGEMIAFLEHMMQLQEPKKQRDQGIYDPDAYLERWADYPSPPPGLQYAEEVVDRFMLDEDEDKNGNEFD